MPSQLRTSCVKIDITINPREGAKPSSTTPSKLATTEPLGKFPSLRKQKFSCTMWNAFELN